jgi:organic hydroperoxide reductase OsmC/OhrA
VSGHTHVYRSDLAWSGTTAAGYEAYDRTHRVTTPPAPDELRLSGDPAFLGDPALMNPEQLLLAAASSCQLLSFLAYAARSRIDVVSYTDAAEGVMPEDDRPMRITSITLRPRIVVAAGTDLDRVRRLIEKAHDACFVANTLNAEMVIEPEVTEAP